MGIERSIFRLLLLRFYLFPETIQKQVLQVRIYFAFSTADIQLATPDAKLFSINITNIYHQTVRTPLPLPNYPLITNEIITTISSIFHLILCLAV